RRRHTRFSRDWSSDVCSSDLNHAQGVALAARRRGVRAVIVMPTSTPSIKVEAVRALGGEAVLHGDAFDEAYEHAMKLAATEGLEVGRASCREGGESATCAAAV